MHAFRGWHSLDRPVPDAVQAALLPPPGSVVAPGTTRSAPGTVLCAEHPGALAHDEAGRCALLVGHPQWRDGALASVARRHGDAAAALAGWQRFGNGLPERLAGDFSLVIVDAPGGCVFAATDRIGRQPLYHAHCAGGLAFASSAEALARLPGVDASIRPQAVHAYLYFHMVPSPLTIHAGIDKLPGAHRLEWRGADCDIACWWQPQFREETGADAGRLGREMRALIDNAVADLAAGHRCGAFLSGGLDSSTVAGVLARLKPADADTFSIGFDVPGYDETGFARIAAGRFGTRQHVYYVSADDVLAAVQDISAHYDEPFGNSSAIPAYYCARLAREAGVERLLAGDGGDELFAGNERYLKQKVFEHWLRLPPALREPLGAGLKALPAIGALGKAASYVRQAETPLPERLETYNFLHRIPAATMFEPDFLQAVDTGWPLGWLRRLWTQAGEASALNRMMYLDWQRTLADNDLRKVERTCALAGVDVVYPLLDDRLIEFSCRVPSALKLPGSRLRDFYKQAMRGFLPEEILNKSKHGFGLPFGIWMRSHAGLRALAGDSLQKLARRGWLRPGFIDEALGLHGSGHAAYYGELVWVLMMLELWLDTHV